LVEFREPALQPGEAFTGTQERNLGIFEDEQEAIAQGRTAWDEFRASESHDVAWWVVRVPGESLARWIADSSAANERVLDLTTNTLVELT
jgi:hypothetical protein